MTERVVQVVDSLNSGGAERMAVDISNELVRRGIAVDLVATRALGSLASAVASHVQVTGLGRRSKWDLGGLHRFRRLLRDRRPDVVHAHGWSSLQFCTAALLSLRSSPPLVFHDHRPAGLERLGRSYRASVWPLTAAHLAVDRELLDPPLRGRRLSVRTVVPNGIPFQRITLKLSHDLADPPRLVVLANLRPQKDHRSLFAAVARVLQQHGPVQLDLLGAMPDPVYEANCRGWIDEFGLSAHANLLGSRPDAGQLLACYDVGVLSSSAESGPIALIEYLAAGLPFAVTDVGEIPAALPPELRVGVVPAGDPVALADALIRVLDDTPEERGGRAKLGQDLAHASYGIGVTVDAILSVYDEIQ